MNFPNEPMDFIEAAMFVLCVLQENWLLIYYGRAWIVASSVCP